jgi:diguanylate cyclase (GGDEF)-like protein
MVMRPNASRLGLRPRITAVVLAGVLALGFVMVQLSSGTLSRSYERAGESELQAIATTWNEGFRSEDLAMPEMLQRRVTRLQAVNQRLHKISLSWYDDAGRTLVVQAGHEHDPDGVKRNITTSEPITVGPNVAPIDAGPEAYREIEAADGAHYGKMIRPVSGDADGEPLAMLELHYDLAMLDEAQAADGRTMSGVGLAAAMLLGTIVSLLLGRAVVRPLESIRDAANRLRDGERDARVESPRRDEIGDLARDFDRMADALLEALKDPLTGLLNHRAFQERLGEELKRAQREGHPLAVVAIDLDDFKSINDAFGHVSGDEALRAVARVVSAVLRAGDLCGRVGGDEFMLALIGADGDAASDIVERIRRRAAALGDGETDGRVTISAGIALYPLHAHTQDELIHLADGAMYWAKSNGKNRSFAYSPSVDLALSAEDAAERNLRTGLINTVHALARAVDAKDGYTHSHSQRVACHALALGRALGLSDERLDTLRTAGVLHDVGKIGIPDAVLLKPGKLTDEELAVMRRHSELGRDIIAGAGLPEIAHWILHLHERFDGRGYPEGLAGEAIPLESRILHVADALEAMTSSRVYRPGMAVERALDELERGAGVQFDPDVAATLIALVRAGELGPGGDAPHAEPAVA